MKIRFPLISEMFVSKIVPKTWGYEQIFAHEKEYCGKLLCFDKSGANFSYHYHMTKKESWFVLSGSFELIVANLYTAKTNSILLFKGDTWTNDPGQPHQLIALEDNSIIIEVSTFDNPNDNYRLTRDKIAPDTE